MTPSGPQFARKALLINYLVWAVAVIVMVVSATTTANLMAQHRSSYAQGLALGLAVDASIAVSLIGDQLLQASGQRSRWGTALRWITAATSLLLNCAQSFQDRDVLGVALHAIPVVLLISLTEAAQDYQVMLNRNSHPPDVAGQAVDGSIIADPMSDGQYSPARRSGHDPAPVPAVRAVGTGTGNPTDVGRSPRGTSTALVDMLIAPSTDSTAKWEPDLWDRATACAVQYREATGRDVRVDDIQALGIGRNRATELRRDILSHFATEPAQDSVLPPDMNELVLAPLNLVVRHRTDTLATLRFTPSPADTEGLRRHVLGAIDSGEGRLTSWITDYAVDIHRLGNESTALLTFKALATQ